MARTTADAKKVSRPNQESTGDPKVSEWPRTTLYMRPGFKAKMDAIIFVSKLPSWELVEQAVEGFYKSMPQDERKLVDAMAEHAANNGGQARPRKTTG